MDRAWRVGQAREVVSYRLLSCGGIEEHMYCQAIFKAGLALSVLGGSGGGDGAAAVDPSWGAADVDTADDTPLKRKRASSGSGGGGAARLTSTKGSGAEALMRLGSVDACDTQGLFDAVVPQGAALPTPAALAQQAAAELPVTVVDRHLSRLSAVLGAQCCVGSARHDALVNLTEERLAALRSHAGLPCAALADPADVPRSPAEVAEWFADAAVAVLLVPASFRPSAAAATGLPAADGGPAAEGLGPGAKTGGAASGLPSEWTPVLAEVMRILTPAWVVDVLGRLDKRAKPHLPRPGTVPAAPEAALSVIVSTLGPGPALKLLRRAERHAVKEWVQHGRAGACGHAPCRGIAAAMAAPGGCPRVDAFLAEHPEIQPLPGGGVPQLPPQPSQVRQQHQQRSQLPQPQPRQRPPALLMQQPQQQQPSRQAGPAGAADPRKRARTDGGDARAAPSAASIAIATAGADAASAALLLSCLGMELRPGAPQPQELPPPLRAALSQAHEHIRAAVALLQGPAFAAVSADPGARLRAIATRLSSIDPPGPRTPAAANVQVAPLRLLLPWAMELAGGRLGQRLGPAAGAAVRAPVATATAAATAATRNTRAPNLSAGPTPPARASSAAPPPPPHRADEATGALLARICATLQRTLADAACPPGRLQAKLAPCLDAQAVAEVEALYARADLDAAALEQCVHEFARRCLARGAARTQGAAASKGPRSGGDEEDEDGEEDDEEGEDGTGSESEYEQLPPEECTPRGAHGSAVSVAPGVPPAAASAPPQKAAAPARSVPTVVDLVSDDEG